MLLSNKLPVAYIFNKLKLELLVVIIISLALYYYAQNFRSEMPDIPISIPSFIGTAISVLLSFKLSQSYDRWWEARKVWGMIVNDSRTMVMQLLAFVEKGNDAEVKQIANRQIGWCYGLANALRKLDTTAAMQPYLAKDDMNYVNNHVNKPLAALQLSNMQIADLYRKNQLNVYHHKQLDNTITRLCVSMGAAERIKGTVFPVTYRLLLRFAIFVFIFTFAIAIDDLRVYSQVPLAVVISSIFLMLEKTATHMQDPFEDRPTDTAMNTISRTIEINIKQLIADSEVPEPMQPEKFYAM
jgi:putative membrane protein